MVVTERPSTRRGLRFFPGLCRRNDGGKGAGRGGPEAPRKRESQPGRRFSITADLDVTVKGEIRNLPEAAWTVYRTPEGMVTDREIA